MPRLYRESPLNAIWEGSGNVIALDVLRAAGRSPDSLRLFLDEIEEARGSDPAFDRLIDSAAKSIEHAVNLEFEARRIVESLALVWAGALLARHGPEDTFAAFAASRLTENHGGLYGTLPPGTRVDSLVASAFPAQPSWG